MKRLLLNICLIFPISLFAQNLLTTDSTYKETYFNGRPKLLKSYSIEKDTIVLNGKYIHYYKNGNIKEEKMYFKGIIVDTLKAYNKNGKLEGMAIFYDNKFPRRLRNISFYSHGKCKIGISEYIQKKDGSVIRDGLLLGYDKNGIAMDSVVFKMGTEISRTIRNDKGNIIFQK